MEACPTKRTQFKWTGLALVIACFASLAVFTWRRCADVMDDFGTQLYITWRISQGAVLYRDLFFFAGGPLSQYYHAGLLHLFGVSLLPILVSNLVIIGLLVATVYLRFARAADATTAFVISLGILLVFAFAQYDSHGNMNYVMPYSHEALHGVFLSILALGFLGDWLLEKRLRHALFAGLCTGLVFLTKPDVFAALAGSGLALAWLIFRERPDTGFLLKSAGLYLSGAFIPPAAFFLSFLSVADWKESLRFTAFAWVPLFKPTVINSPIYRWCTGLDQPLAHLVTMAAQFVVVIVVLLALGGYLAVWGKAAAKLGCLRPRWLGLLILSLPLGLLFFAAAVYEWRNCGASLQLLAGVTILWMTRECRRSIRFESVFPLLWSVFSLLLTAKLGVFCRIWHYGFILAMPALATAVFLALWLVPGRLQRKWGTPFIPFRAMIGLTLLLGFGQLFAQSFATYRSETLPLAADGDRLATSARPEQEAIRQTLDWARRNIPASASLASLPHGAELNYLTRHTNSTASVFWDPNMLNVFGETNMTDDFERHPPDYIFLTRWHEMGIGYLGDQFGRDLMRSVQTNYVLAKTIQAGQRHGEAFEIKILRRSSLPAPHASN